MCVSVSDRCARSGGCGGGVARLCLRCGCGGATSLQKSAGRSDQTSRLPNERTPLHCAALHCTALHCTNRHEAPVLTAPSEPINPILLTRRRHQLQSDHLQLNGLQATIRSAEGASFPLSAAGYRPPPLPQHLSTSVAVRALSRCRCAASAPRSAFWRWPTTRRSNCSIWATSSSQLPGQPHQAIHTPAARQLTKSANRVRAHTSANRAPCTA